MISILQSNGYIIVDIFINELNKTTVFYKLTEKGEKFVKVLDEK